MNYPFFKYVLWLGLTQLLVAQAEVRSVGIETRENGLVMTIRLDQSIPQDNITGWNAINGWFYVTLYDAVADSDRLAKTAFKYPVRDFQTITMDESSQIGIKLVKNVDQYEFYLSDSPPEILVSLRYPVERVPFLADKNGHPDKKHGTRKNIVIQTPPEEPEMSFSWKRVKTIGYFLGTTLTVSGLVQQEKDPESQNNELSTGVIILITTYILDKIF